MRYSVIALLCVALAQTADCIDCLKTLSRYNVDRIVEGYTDTETPPSSTRELIWIDLCSTHEDKKPKECDDGSIFCYRKEVKLQDTEPVVTEVINFSNNNDIKITTSQDAFSVYFPAVQWGAQAVEAHLNFVCNEKEGGGEVQVVKWDKPNSLSIDISGPSSCFKKDNTASPKHGGFGSWILWLFLYAILFTVIYLLVVSYLNTRNGSLQDFREEFTDRSGNLLTSLPDFARELVGKVVNSNSSSRGGYSAV
ncbi:HDL398Cp [Eremothecium sinecaudum]|uniref:Autophagy-related protein 27 n=1 Tax=Eremothecium sinecaudum TaxID=45286 RepID=A0A0X8HRY7_9SACH|nr:HDL398Cp [Eremothecium sinecaudum]AMD20346.1 HDL398Cp [Eremothecium sinecaudum]